MKNIPILVIHSALAPALPEQIVQLLAKGHPSNYVCTSICNYTDWKSFKLSATGYHQIFIQVELGWNEPQEGYKVALQLIITRLANHINHLRFISYESQKALFRSTNPKYHPLIKSFLHLHLPLSSIRPFYYSKLRYKFILKYCLTAMGQIDVLIHDLRPFINAQHSTDALSRHIFTINALGAHIVGEKAVQITRDLDMLMAAKSDDEKTEISAKVSALIQELEQKRDEKRSDAIPRKLPYRAILVEDNDMQRAALKEIISPYFREIAEFSDGEQVREVLGNNIKTYYYHALFVDMELLDEHGFDQPVMGTDLLDFCEDHLPGMATRIITALPKRGLRMLISNKYNDHIIAKNHSGTILSSSDNLDEIFAKLAKEIEGLEDARDLKGPIRGPFADGKTLKLLYYRIKAEDLSGHKAMMQETHAKAEAFFKGSIKTDQVAGNFGRGEHIGQKDNDDEPQLLKHILLHRAIALLHNKETGQIFYGYFSEKRLDAAGKYKFKGLTQGYRDKFEPPLPDDAKQYFINRLGFNGKWNREIGTGLYQQIGEDNLFPEEKKWLDSLNIKALKEDPIKYTHPDDFERLSNQMKILKNHLTNNKIKISRRHNKLLKINDLRYADLEPYQEDWQIFEEYLEQQTGYPKAVENARKVGAEIQRLIHR